MNFVEIESVAGGRSQIGGTNGGKILRGEILNNPGMSPEREYVGNFIASKKQLLSRSGSAFERRSQDGVEQTLADVIEAFHHVFDQVEVVHNDQVVLIDQIKKGFLDSSRFIGRQLGKNFPHT